MIVDVFIEKLFLLIRPALLKMVGYATNEVNLRLFKWLIFAERISANNKTLFISHQSWMLVFNALLLFLSDCFLCLLKFIM